MVNHELFRVKFAAKVNGLKHLYLTFMYLAVTLITNLQRGTLSSIY